jgi:hypothetical protein
MNIFDLQTRMAEFIEAFSRDGFVVLAPVTIRRYLPVLGSDGRDLSGG